MKRKGKHSFVDINILLHLSIPTDDIVSSVGCILACQRELTEDDQEQNSFHSTISLTHRLFLTKDKSHSLTRLKIDKDTVLLSAGKGSVTAVMDKDHTDKMDLLVNDKQAYEALKRDPTLALQ